MTLVVLSSCSNSETKNSNATIPNKNEKHKIQEKTYLAYSPKSIKLEDVLFVAIDAHADAQLALNHLRWSADNYGFRFIALKNVENNDPQFEQHINQGVQQAQEDLDIQAIKIFYLGFSGGARMALRFAQTHQAAGVVMLGAGPGKQTTSFPFPLAMITGTRDFNFIEQYYPISSPQVQNPDVITLHWTGKHEWPDSSIINDAVTFVLYTSKSIAETAINRKLQLEKAKQTKQNKILFFYFKELELISKTSSGKLHEKTQESIEAMQNSKKVQRYFQNINEILMAEQKRNQLYIKYLDEKPISWWENTIAKLKDLANTNKGFQADSYARSSAFLGILLYSRTSAAVSGRGNAKLLPKYLTVYEIVEPENPDLFYFKAVYEYALGNNDATIQNLKKALQFGFKDNNKLHQSFPQMIISAAQKHE